MHDIAGLVALAILGLWIAYLVPHRLRYRQQLLESRAEDRFSAALRVLAVTDARRRDARTAEARVECGPDSAKRSGLLSPARGVPFGGRPAAIEGRGGVVERPYGTQDKITAEDARRVAQQRAQRAVALARRTAAARRRGVLTGVLLVASIAAWVVVGVTSLAVVAAVVPTVLLLGVLGLGRRAVVQGRAADAAWERQQRAPRAARPAGRPARVTGRATRPSDSHTEAIARVGEARSVVQRPAGAAPVAVAPAGAPAGAATVSSDAVDRVAPEQATTVERTGSCGDAAPSPVFDDGTGPGRTGPDDATSAGGSDGWNPVPVPRPTYSTKATAPRREPLPLVIDEPASALVPAAATDGAGNAAATPAEDGTATPPALDLDAILARRRAAGQ